MFSAAEIVSYIDMCREEGVSLQRGMNFRLHDGISVILMSRRPGAPYKDRIEHDGNVLIYEGHDVPRTKGKPDPKTVDQPKVINGKLTQNGLFAEAAGRAAAGEQIPEIVRVYEKIKQGIWVYNGTFALTDAWTDFDNGRRVYRFRLELQPEQVGETANRAPLDLPHQRMIPSNVKLEVWKRDQGRCVICGSDNELHFDHILPFSRGGTSLTAGNIQLLCARHNLSKRDKIE